MKKKTSLSSQLPLKDICSIIRSCRKNNVLSLKYQGLELVLKDDGETTVGFTPLPEIKNPRPDQVEPDTYEHNVEKFGSELETLNLTDPEAFEDQIMAGMLDGNERPTDA